MFRAVVIQSAIVGLAISCASCGGGGGAVAGAPSSTTAFVHAAPNAAASATPSAVPTVAALALNNSSVTSTMGPNGTIVLSDLSQPMPFGTNPTPSQKSLCVNGTQFVTTQDDEFAQDRYLNATSGDIDGSTTAMWGTRIWYNPVGKAGFPATGHDEIDTDPSLTPYYTPFRKAIDGSLQITAVPIPASHLNDPAVQPSPQQSSHPGLYHYLSGFLNGKAQTYGYIEVSARQTHAQGMWSAPLWLIAHAGSDGHGNGYTEMDANEVFGTLSADYPVFQTLHRNGAGPDLQTNHQIPQSPPPPPRPPPPHVPYVRHLLDRNDDRVATYLPDAPHAAEITIRQLLNQTSGLRDSGLPPPIFSDAATPQSLYRDIAATPLASVPGTTFAYSNTNYVILGAIVERVSGMSYAAFLRRRIVHTTSFSGITYGEPPADVFATGYIMARPGEPVPAPHWPMNVAFSAGGLSASAVDLVRWDDAFFNGRVVPKHMVDELTTPPALATNPQVPYAAGWWQATIDGHAEITHNGAIPGFVSVNAYFPGDHLAIVVLANISGYRLDGLVRDLFRAYVPPTAAQLAADLQGAPGEDLAVRARVQKQWNDVADGKIDRRDYDPAASLGIPADVVARVGADLNALGPPTAFIFAGSFIGGTGSTTYVYHVRAPHGRDLMTLSINAAGLIDGIYFKAE